MSERLDILNRVARRILTFAVALAVVRLLRSADSKPVVDILAVAVPAGVALELLRLRHAAAANRGTRRLGWSLAAAAGACWVGGIWLERDASDHGAWIVVCGIVCVLTVAIVESIRRRVTRPLAQPMSGRCTAAGHATAVRWLTLPSVGSTIAFVAFELIVVDWIGGLAAHRFGFDESYLTPLTIIVCGGAGFVARRLGSSGRSQEPP